MKRLVILITTSLLFLSAPIAKADLTVSATSPKAGTSLTVGPNVVSVTASGPLLDAGNLIVVNDPNGNAVDDGSITVNGNSVLVGMKPLTITGVYTVNYTLVSDGAPDLTGSYTFMYSSPGAISTPSAQPTTSNSGSINNGSNAASNAFVYFMLFLAALVAIFLVWYARVTFGGKPKRKVARPAETISKPAARKAPVKKSTKRSK